jgi:hypothetical protein
MVGRDDERRLLEDTFASAVRRRTCSLFPRPTRIRAPRRCFAACSATSSSRHRAEIAWSFRKLLEHVAVACPLVCVFDDIHWGEETFLDLLEHVADLSRGAPILYLVEHAKALVALGGVLELAGDAGEAARALAEAVELYERKGHVRAARVRERLAGGSARR